MTVRQVGVEEELFVVAPDGRLSTLSDQVVRRARGQDAIDHELFLQQVETTTTAHHDARSLRADLVEQRRVAVEAADRAGVRLAAMPVDVVGGSEPTTTPDDRYERMLHEFGEIGRLGLTCGMHVHVDVEDHEAVPIVDALRPWTPFLMAASAGSPIVHGRDTGYASWRGFAWDAWPTAGPVEPFGDRAGYDRALDAMLASGAALDPHMLYLDARVAEDFPTVEIRVADVCANVDDAVLVAELARAMVDTVFDHPRREWRVDLLRAARWRARRDGLGGRLLDPTTGGFSPAPEVVTHLVEALGPALDRAGSLELVTEGLERLLRDGTGAVRQRRVFEADGPTGLVDDLVDRTRACLAAQSGTSPA